MRTNHKFLDKCTWTSYGPGEDGMIVKKELIISCCDVYDYDEMDNCYHSLSECFVDDDDMNLCLQNYAEELYEDAFDAIFEKVGTYTYIIDVRAVRENRRDISPEYVKERVNLFMPLIKRFIKDVFLVPPRSNHRQAINHVKK